MLRESLIKQQRLGKDELVACIPVGNTMKHTFYCPMHSPFTKDGGDKTTQLMCLTVSLWEAAFPGYSSALVKASGRLLLLSTACMEKSSNTRHSVEVT